MNINYKLLCNTSLILLFFMAIGSCKKTDRPPLGEYPTDDIVLPPGDLRFYTPFDLKSNEFRFKVGDSISGNPAFFSGDPLTLAAGVKDTAIQGEDNNAILYLNANDFPKSTSFTVAFWAKNTLPKKDKAEFAFSLVEKANWGKSAMFILFDHPGGGATADSAVIKFYVDDEKGDKWFELTGNNRMYKLYDGNWHHLAFVYDETTSNMLFYKDGQLVHTINWAGHGAIQLDPAKITNFVLAGWNKHVGIEGNKDDWVQSWQGGMDQFRLYNKALSATDIQSLFNNRL